MKKLVLALAIVVPLCYAADNPAAHIMVAPEAVQWQPWLGTAQRAVISGDPTKEGAPYTLRLKLPANFRVPPHWHPVDEHVTVLSGTFLIATGRDYDPAKFHTLKTGAFTMMPKETPHFALAKGETILQLHGLGPFKVIWVNPEDDPSRAARK